MRDVIGLGHGGVASIGVGSILKLEQQEFLVECVWCMKQWEELGMTKLFWPVSWKDSVAFHQDWFSGKDKLSFRHVKLRFLRDMQMGMKVGNCICESRIGH